MGVFGAAQFGLERRRGFFDLWGVDFMIDCEFKLHLLEVNSSPAMFFDSSPTLHELVPRLIGNALDLVFEAQRPGHEYVVPSERGRFELVIDETSGYVYGQ